MKIHCVLNRGLLLLSALFLNESFALAVEPVGTNTTVMLLYENSGVDIPKQPQACMDPHGNAHLTFGSGNRVYHSTSTGSTFSAPQVAFEIPNMSLGMRRGPRIAATSSSIVITAIGGAQGKGKDGDILAYRSTDKGQSWLGPVRVNDVEASAREGLHAMTSSENGTLWCVWLDLRNKRTELFASSSTDGGQSWSGNQLVYRSPERSICECCHPSIVARGNAVHVLFRNSLAGNRDMYLVSSHDNGKTFDAAIRLGHDQWELNACPMDGGMLAVDDRQHVTTVWRRGGTIYATIDRPNAETVVGKGEQAWVVAKGNQSFAVWTTGREGDLIFSRLRSSDSTKLGASSRDPVIITGASAESPLLVFWEHRLGSKTEIMCARIAD